VGMMTALIERIVPGAPRARRIETLDPLSCRRLMSHWATGVSVVTSLGAGGPKGCTVNSLTSLSLDPLLLLVALHGRSSTLDAVRASRRFCVNVLASDQEDLCHRFARPAADIDKFAGLAFEVIDGAPVLAGCLASIRCEAEHIMSGGDHEIVVARPLAGHTTEAAPLIFFRRGYKAAA
jgi:3-hydroxy-9,10-secoandrosta-1,3,5(10)-triene-9,17-dione monooxygenase reductase component